VTHFASGLRLGVADRADLEVVADGDGAGEQDAGREASGASTRTVERTERRNESFIRNDPLNGYESKRTNEEVLTHALRQTAARGESGKLERVIRWTGTFG